ncbi:glycosyltransferase [Plantactinospora sp. WMMB782]|uniref:glycosyltransferase n=1 Tax=Plantactinospora sp. WMMB782 TaxID=3404121 RepID=UPI003B954E62
MSLNVLHVLVPEPPGEVGGADMHVLDLARYQLRAGLRPVVVERGSAEFANRLRDVGVPVVSASGMRWHAALRVLAAEMAARRPDIVHAHGYDADYWAAVVRLARADLFRERALAFTQHGIVEDTRWHRAKTLLDAGCTRLADGVIVCADGLAGRVRGWRPAGPVRYIPNGVSEPELVGRQEARHRLGVPPEALLIAYVGRLSPEKRPDRVLTLVADARAAGLPVHALVAGAGGLGPHLHRQAETLGITDAVTFAGLVRDVGVVYAATDALVLLSDTETTSRVVIEAMHSGVPVLASAVGGVPELLAGGAVGTLVAPGDRAGAHAGLRQLLDARAQFIGPARRRARERYAVEVMGQRVTEFYQEIRSVRRAGAR